VASEGGGDERAARANNPPPLSVDRRALVRHPPRALLPHSPSRPPPAADWSRASLPPRARHWAGGARVERRGRAARVTRNTTLARSALSHFCDKLFWVRRGGSRLCTRRCASARAPANPQKIAHSPDQRHHGGWHRVQLGHGGRAGACACRAREARSRGSLSLIVLLILERGSECVDGFSRMDGRRKEPRACKSERGARAGSDEECAGEERGRAGRARAGFCGARGRGRQVPFSLHTPTTAPRDLSSAPPPNPTVQTRHRDPKSHYYRPDDAGRGR
jgi:hypothetical protein